MKKTVKAWAVFVNEKIITVYKDKQEALFAANLERYMPVKRLPENQLVSRIILVKVRPITITYDDGRKK